MKFDIQPNQNERIALSLEIIADSLERIAECLENKNQ